MLTEHICVDSLGTVLLESIEPDELKVEVIVGEYNTGRCSKAGDVIDLAQALEGSTHGTADIFTYPACLYLVGISGSVKLDYVFGISSEHFCILLKIFSTAILS